jgi:V/A-type H+-transporting ATPase subunit C
LEEAARLGAEAAKGGTQTLFELACDNAALKYFDGTYFISFGPEPVFAYLAKLEWEITAIRMILTGKLTGISTDVIRERLRECHV